MMKLSQDRPGRFQNSYDFGTSMAWSLILEHLKRRYQRKDLSTQILAKIALLLGQRPETPTKRQPVTSPGVSFEGPGQKRYCYQCNKEIHGEGYTKAHSSKNQVTSQCCRCGKALCTKHKLNICRPCANSVRSDNLPSASDEAMRD